MKSSKFSHCIGALLFGAAVLSGCNKHHMLAMAEETDATGTKSSSMGQKKFGTYYPGEEPFDCAAKGNTCRKLVWRVCEDCDTPPLDLDTQELKTTARIAEENSNMCAADLKNERERLKNKTKSLAKYEVELDKCQIDRDDAKNWSEQLINEKKVIQDKLDQSVRDLGEANTRYQLCTTHRGPLPTEAANTGAIWPTRVDCAIGGVAIGGAVIGALVWKKMSATVAQEKERAKIEKERATALEAELEKQIKIESELEKSLEGMRKKVQALGATRAGASLTRSVVSEDLETLASHNSVAP